MKYFTILQADNPVFKLLKLRSSPAVISNLFIRCMSSAIDLDDEVMFAAQEIGDERANGSLSYKLEAAKTTVPQLLPQALFRNAFSAPELPRHCELGIIAHY